MENQDEFTKQHIREYLAWAEPSIKVAWSWLWDLECVRYRQCCPADPGHTCSSTTCMVPLIHLIYTLFLQFVSFLNILSLKIEMSVTCSLHSASWSSFISPPNYYCSYGSCPLNKYFKDLFLTGASLIFLFFFLFCIGKQIRIIEYWIENNFCQSEDRIKSYHVLSSGVYKQHKNNRR